MLQATEPQTLLRSRCSQALNSDMLMDGIRCDSTTNRNFEDRQGRGDITHLMSAVIAHQMDTVCQAHSRLSPASRST
ncbi:hypothetical protein FSY59_17545 [Comamonas sp. Z3]|nr:hypothetical protein FSY59_17545 [Comamonas sp. Z3]